MKITVYSIYKKSQDDFESIVNQFVVMAKKFAVVEFVRIFSADIVKGSNLGGSFAQQAYSNAYANFVKDGFSIALDLRGKKYDSFGFAKILESKQKINFFVGGAFGFEEKFLQSCDIVVSLGDLTMGHKIVNIVLMEQIFRGLCINHNHPYHK